MAKSPKKKPKTKAEVPMQKTETAKALIKVRLANHLKDSPRTQNRSQMANVRKVKAERLIILTHLMMKTTLLQAKKWLMKRLMTRWKSAMNFLMISRSRSRRKLQGWKNQKRAKRQRPMSSRILTSHHLTSSVELLLVKTEGSKTLQAVICRKCMQRQ